MIGLCWYHPVAVVGDGSSKTSCIHSFVCWHGMAVWICKQMDECGHRRILEENWLGVVKLVELEVISLLIKISVQSLSTVHASMIAVFQCWELGERGPPLHHNFLCK